MSILNGKISYDVIKAEDNPFGTKLECVNFIPLEDCIGIERDYSGRYVYAVYNKGLLIYDAQNAEQPVLISCLEEVTSGREIIYSDGFLYIVARENGLYIVDVTNPNEPYITAIYDTLELATGVDASNGYCFVANRHLGVEIIDVHDPKAPKYVSSFMCGEAQSVYINGNFAYVGDWMNKQVYITDVSDIKNPICASIINVDGFADGICVRGCICYIVTGHHSSRLKNRRKYDKYPYVTSQMLNDGYGGGHGLEIYDVSDPCQPEYLSNVKFPPMFGAPDFWKISLSANTAFVCDSSNGMFAVNISDPLNPYIEAYYTGDVSDKQEVSSPQVQKRYSPLNFCECLDGYVYVGGMESGLHIIKCDKSKKENRENKVFNNNIISANKVFCCDGQIHGIVCKGNNIFVAAGNSGLLALDSDFNVRDILDGDVKDVKLCRDYIISAKGQGGIDVCRYGEKNGFELCFRTLIGGGRKTARHISVLSDRLVAVQTGQRCIDFYRFEQNGKMSKLHGFDTYAMLYYRNLCPSLFCGKYFAYTSLNHGVNWYETDGDNAKPISYSLNIESCPIEDGIAVCGDYAIVISRGRYGVLKDVKQTENINFTVNKDKQFKGIPFVFGSKLILLNRCLSYADVFDISDINKPCFNGRAWLPKPSAAEYINDKIYVCCGHDGIYEIEC